MSLKSSENRKGKEFRITLKTSYTHIRNNKGSIALLWIAPPVTSLRWGVKPFTFTARWKAWWEPWRYIFGDLIRVDLVYQHTAGYSSKSPCHFQMNYYHRLFGIGSRYDCTQTVSHTRNSRFRLKNPCWLLLSSLWSIWYVVSCYLAMHYVILEVLGL